MEQRIILTQEDLINILDIFNNSDLKELEENILPELHKKDLEILCECYDKDEYGDLKEDINGNIAYQKKNPNLRSEFVIFDLLPSHLIMRERCKRDIVFFAENFYHITTDDGFELIKLRDYQKIMLKAFSNSDETIKGLKYYDKSIIDVNVEPKYTIDYNFKDSLLYIALLGRQLGKCCFFFSKVTVRHKQTKKIEKISIGRLYLRIFLTFKLKYIIINSIRKSCNNIKKLGKKLWKKFVKFVE